MGDSAEYARRDRARRTARARVEAALADYVDLLTEHEPTRSRRDSDELARLRVAYRIRDEVAELAEQQVDRSIEAARHRRPRGHSWAEIGEAMDGHTGQAAGKRARQRGLDTGRAWAPSAAATARAERAEQRRAQRALTQALTEAATRWPGRRLHRVDHDDGTVTFEPDPPAVAVPAAVPPPSPAPPARTRPAPADAPRPARRYADARDRALRGMAGGEVFRPELVRRAPGSASVKNPQRS
jgi:hypothetical protein